MTTNFEIKRETVDGPVTLVLQATRDEMLKLREAINKVVSAPRATKATALVNNGIGKIEFNMVEE